MTCTSVLLLHKFIFLLFTLPLARKTRNSNKVTLIFPIRKKSHIIFLSNVFILKRAVCRGSRYVEKDSTFLHEFTHLSLDTV